MIKIEANTLQEAYLDAAKEFNCSVTELDIEIVQNANSGFLGMFKKTAIIEVSKKGSSRKENRGPKQETNTSPRREKNFEKKRKQKPRREDNRKEETKVNNNTTTHKKAPEKQISSEIQEKPKQPEIKVDIDKAIKTIEVDINRLFKESCFEIDNIKVSKYDDETILIEFSGEDVALLIGKEGYRYKALSYLLYNWINIKYGLNIRLEIAEFLKNQEEMIGKYLVPVIERVRNNGRGQTKILDGVLIKIALEKLRVEFPEKYVGIKSGREGGRFIVINDFNRKVK
ncbi:MAG: Jag N-terminal domain-containing protein [Sulfurospirillaceae bacterium]|nr:Jag N-terminal domain-containing protein [Sulfurospirillaceae bacterium]